ncbi:MAG: hypothetical protein AAF585_16410, partial [Verrucomicrobiota bacterium]
RDSWRIRFAGHGIPSIGRIGDALIEVQAGFDFARVACELERFYLSEDVYPNTFQQLPEWSAVAQVVERSEIEFSQSDDGRYELYGPLENWRYRRVENGR